ncbi:ATP-dependent DNA ligase [Bradyrhizobium barranii]|uniref:ATP-dependent DNA ligase n=1 Tax=Bradyrhizobium TaxID=374 RepID=UPI003F1FB2C3
MPAGLNCFHEIKFDGYRMCAPRRGDDVRLITKNGHDWTSRYRWIVESALKNREKHFVLDGEAVVLGIDGVADFSALHSRKYDHEVQFCAFDVLVLGGEDLRPLPLDMRKSNLERRLLRRRPHLCGTVRTRCDRAGPVPEGPRMRPRGDCLEASRPALYRRPHK